MKTKRSWLEQMETELDRWRKTDFPGTNKEVETEPAMSLDEEVEYLADSGTDPDDIYLVALREQTRHAIKNAGTEIAWAYGRCESPIERAMAAALVVAGGQLAERAFFADDRGRTMFLGLPVKDHASYDWFSIQPQVKLGEYRVDFLVTYSHVALPAEGRPGYDPVSQQAVIECDGHDFHERTKEQARRDKQRDRFLQSMGMPVFRFTGSEIWRAPFHCASEALIHLQKLHKQRWDGQLV